MAIFNGHFIKRKKRNKKQKKIPWAKVHWYKSRKQIGPMSKLVYFWRLMLFFRSVGATTTAVAAGPCPQHWNRNIIDKRNKCLYSVAFQLLLHVLVLVLVLDCSLQFAVHIATYKWTHAWHRKSTLTLIPFFVWFFFSVFLHYKTNGNCRLLSLSFFWLELNNLFFDGSSRSSSLSFFFARRSQHFSIKVWKKEITFAKANKLLVRVTGNGSSLSDAMAQKKQSRIF